MKRNIGVLIDPNGPKRAVEHIKFANQDHRATQPLIAGSLERKKMFNRYDAGFYVVTPSKYLHEFKTDDDFAKDPSPENSLYLPDCMVGAVDGVKFNVRGKDASGNAMLNKMSRSHEFAFKAHTADDAKKWHSVIASVAGQTSNEMPAHDDSPAASPVAGKGEVAGPVDTVAPTHESATSAIPQQATQTTGTVPQEGTVNSQSVPSAAVPGQQTGAPPHSAV